MLHFAAQPSSPAAEMLNAAELHATYHSQYHAVVRRSAEGVYMELEYGLVVVASNIVLDLILVRYMAHAGVTCDIVSGGLIYFAAACILKVNEMRMALNMVKSKNKYIGG